MNSPDFSTPEKAVLALEQAYRAKDIEAAIAAKDFVQDACYFLGLQFGQDIPKKVDLKKWSKTLEKSFRDTIAQSGFREYQGIKTSFVAKEVVSESEVVLTQRFEGPLGKMDKRLLVVKTSDGWRTVLAPDFDTL